MTGPTNKKREVFVITKDELEFEKNRQREVEKEIKQLKTLLVSFIF